MLQQTKNHALERALPVIVWIVCSAILFYDLGGAALFEPDEGRNAEKAREILLLDDWITPHENFLPVLDKPVFFYWLIAASYRAFGVSEWAARLPSALAALGCLVVVYRFARLHWGRAEAVWSILILVTTAEFFILSRVVISDMTLVFCVTLALCAFYNASQAANPRARTGGYFLMYVAMAGGALIKGPIAAVLPGMIIAAYLGIRKDKDTLKQMRLAQGAALFLLLVAPGYLWMESRNPGYLTYFFRDEHFGRFFGSEEFDRSAPWYYFFAVVLVGLLPWTLVIPLTARERWRARWDGKNLFLLLWATLPLVFFSLSQSKLPHYLLPIFPPVALWIAQGAARGVQSRAQFSFYTPWLIQFVILFYFVLGLAWPPILPQRIEPIVERTGTLLIAAAVLLVGIYALFLYARARGLWQGQGSVCLAHAAGALVFMTLIAHLMAAASLERSAKPVVEAAAPWVGRGTQVIFYDTYLTGALFYLGAERPVWVVTRANKKNTVLGNFYLAEDRARPQTPWGAALYTFDEFGEIWSRADRPMVVIVKEKNIPKMKQRSGASGAEIGRFDEYVVLRNRPAETLRHAGKRDG